MRTSGVIALFVALHCPSGAQALPPDKLYSMLSPSIWRVVVADASGRSITQGSAVVIAPETLLTNCHVLAKGSSIVVRRESVSMTAKLQYIDVERDMCQIVASGLTAPAVRMGDSDRLNVGQRIYTLGNPLGMELTLSDGLVSALRKDESHKLKYIQISAPISHGSSGGGLFDEEGVLVGITSAGMENGQNLNIAIPIRWYRELAERSGAALASYSGSDRSRVGERPQKPASARPSYPPPSGQGPGVGGAATIIGQTPSLVQPATSKPMPSAPRVPYAGIEDVEKLAKLSPNIRAAYLEFLTRPLPRAFALAGSRGYWSAWTRTPRNPLDDPEPAVRVLTGCEQYHRRPCFLYAVDNTVVYRAASTELAPPK